MTCGTQQCLKKQSLDIQGLSEFFSKLLQRHPLLGVISDYTGASLRNWEAFG